MALRADDVDLGRDRDLVERYQSGDPQAFDDLYRRYFDRLHRFCLRHTRDSHEAEEVAQEAFVKALRSMHSLKGERRFYPWMTVIAKRISIDRHRKLSRLELTDDPDGGSVEPDVDHLFDAVDASHVRAAMGNLGPRHREVLVLRETQGMSYAAIADHLDVPVTTVEALLHRARKALRREYAAVSGEPRGLFGLPWLGVAATRIGQLRAKLSEKWVEATAVAAPVAVGAVTAAVILVPTSTGAPDAMPSRDRSPSAVIAEPASTVPEAPDDPVVVPPAPVPTPAADATPEAAPAPPAAELGPVDVFVGPEGAERAGDEARQMPVGGENDSAVFGADPPATSEGTKDFVEGALDELLAPASSSSGDQPTLIRLLGGSR